uniref:Uncharacterized protein n=1 Tax=Candidatus Kentrum sp. DK TaxID=2126562 RepID=A0A450SKS3_9GAMM|nr:MAG: hypothetical protein BECKDK2373C_GA0170839_104220 [Candidatus Kentron sp. DK]
MPGNRREIIRTLRIRLIRILIGAVLAAPTSEPHLRFSRARIEGRRLVTLRAATKPHPLLCRIEFFHVKFVDGREVFRVARA